MKELREFIKETIRQTKGTTQYIDFDIGISGYEDEEKKKHIIVEKNSSNRIRFRCFLDIDTREIEDIWTWQQICAEISKMATILDKWAEAWAPKEEENEDKKR